MILLGQMVNQGQASCYNLGGQIKEKNNGRSKLKKNKKKKKKKN
jgi:hypothetical protein